MRKDVKLGFTIGGVLLAVVIVYVLVISGSPQPAPVTMVTSEPAESQAPPQADSAANNPPQRAEQPVQVPESKLTLTPSAEQGIDPFKSPNPAPVAPAAETTIASNNASGEDKWAGYPAALPIMLTTTPQPSPAVAVTGSENKPAASSNTPVSIPSMRSSPGESSSAGSSPSTRPSGPRTHVVQSGETFALIAEAAYGNAAYYPHLLRANPNLDPKKLRPGMVVNLPAVNEVRADRATVASNASANTSTQAPSIDPKNEYRVQAGDSLYRISTKLYGKADRVDKIYEANKSTIGSDRTKLKIGMVLKLPEAPTER